MADKTPEERIKELETQLSEANTKLGSATKEAASYRVQRNEALRKSHALETITTAHQIDTSALTEDSLKSLEIEDGKIKGEFAYTVPNPSSNGKTQPRSTPSESGMLSEEALANMSEDEINKRWDEVSSFLAS